MKSIINKNFVSIVVLLCLAFGIFITNVEAMKLNYDGKIHEYTADPITLNVEGNTLQTEVPPVILEDRTLVPARDIFEKMGAKVEWNDKTKKVYVTYDDKIVILTINQKKSYINEKEQQLDVPAKLINNKTMIPAAFVAKSLGFYVEWDGENRVVYISKKAIELPSKPEVEDITQYDISKKELIWEEKDGLSKKQLSGVVGYEEYKNANIKDIKISKPDEEDFNVIISADSKISGLIHNYYEKKIVIDIDRSIMRFDINKFTLAENKFVRDIQTSESTGDTKKTRVTLDLKDNFNYDVKLIDNRKNIQISFFKNEIYKMRLYKDDNTNIINIEGLYKPYAKIFRLTNPERIVVDIPYAYSNIKYKNAKITSNVIKSVRTSQFDNDTVRFVLETNTQADFDFRYVGNNAIEISLKDNDTQTIKYENTPNIEKGGSKNQITLNKLSTTQLDISKILIKNNYLTKNIKLTFPGDYTKDFGIGDIKINNENLSNINISTEGKTTVVNIYAKTIFECDITENSERIFINLLKPREKYNKIVLIDAGHGGRDPGAVVSGINEKDLNLAMVKELIRLLEIDGTIKFYLTRTTDVYPTLQERVDLAQDIQADIFISVHNNATFNTAVKGTETLYFPTSQENASGLNGKKLAEIMQRTLSAQIGSYNKGIIPRDGLYLLKHTTMPAVIVEVGYMSNAEELNKLKTSGYINQSAMGMYRGILEVFAKFPTKR